jgi:hypothetical protein
MVVELNQSKGKILPARRAGLNIYAQSCKSDDKGNMNVNLVYSGGTETDSSDNVSLSLAAAKTDHAKLVKGLLDGGYVGIAEVVSRCGTKPLPAARSIDIRGDEKGQRYVCGVCHCNSMICPLCAKYYAAKRREKLQVRGEELAKHIFGGCDCSQKISSIGSLPVCLLDGKPVYLKGAQAYHMVTTLRHRMGAKYVVLVGALSKVHKKMQQRAFWRKSVIGNVRSMELTYGINGFHPHYHNLIILGSWVDVEWFSNKVKLFWEEELRKLGRSCDWKADWFTKVRGESFDDMVRYLNKAINEVSLSANKIKSPWQLPASAYVEVYKTGKGVRWFGVGGVWKCKETVKAESESELENERESKDPILVSIPVEAWNKLPVEDRLLVRAVVSDKNISNNDCVMVVIGICYPQIE